MNVRLKNEQKRKIFRLINMDGKIIFFIGVLISAGIGYGIGHLAIGICAGIVLGMVSKID